MKILYIKYHSVDSNEKLRAKLDFVNHRIIHGETTVNFPTTLEQKANETRNYDIKNGPRTNSIL